MVDDGEGNMEKKQLSLSPKDANITVKLFLFFQITYQRGTIYPIQIGELNTHTFPEANRNPKTGNLQC